MKILICGGRDYTNQVQFYKFIRGFIAENGPITHIICGGQRGADDMAVKYANHRRIKLTTYPAAWEKYGPGAGPIRNQIMLDANPDISFLIAFPGAKGTADMVTKAKNINLTVIEVKNE